MAIIVCPLARAPEIASQRRPSHVISLLDPGAEFPAFAHDHHRLRLEVYDVDQQLEEPGSPTDVHVGAILKFVEHWDREAPMLVHCYAGISRSTAAAFIAACAHNPGTSEKLIARALREASSTASPNLRIIALADALMNKNGRMIEAMHHIGRGRDWADYDDIAPFQLASRFE